MDEEFIRNRITELRLKKGISEYQLSLELGQNRGYIQAISSGRALPSMKQFLNICEYFEITPLQFFDATENTPQLVRKALDGIRTLSDDDLIILLGLIARLNQGNDGRRQMAPAVYLSLYYPPFSHPRKTLCKSNLELREE